MRATPSSDPFWAELGYSDERCPDCGVRMHITESGRVICLNACGMRVSEYRKMQAGLAESWARIKAQDDTP